MSTVTVVTPYHGSQSFVAITPELDAALSEAWNSYNRSATITVDGSRRTLDRFMDGWLLDNCPLNIVFGLPWIAGQQEALNQAGRVCGTSLPGMPVPASTQTQPTTPPTKVLVTTNTPPPMGAQDGGTSVNMAPTGGIIQATDTPGGLTIMPGQVYRLIMVTAPGRVDTGATYPLCSRSNPDACHPKQFATVGEAVTYAQANNETPLQVSGADEAWAIVEGKMAINPANVLGSGGGENTLMWIAAGIAAIFVLPKIFKKRSV